MLKRKKEEEEEDLEFALIDRPAQPGKNQISSPLLFYICTEVS